MKFDRYKFLRDQALQKLKITEMDEMEYFTMEDAAKLDSLILAYIGDAVYSMYVRERVILCSAKVQVVHNLVTAIISAKGQSQSWHFIEPLLTETESMLTKRARNSNSHVPKSSTVQEYRLSTALEALFGYLYITNQMVRLRVLCKIALTGILEKL